MNPDKNQTALIRPYLQESPDPSAGDPIALVHAQETTVHNPDDPSYRRFLLSGLGDKPNVVDKMYSDVDARDGTNRTGALRRCRTSAWFVQHEITGKIRVASKRCHLRWCPLCEITDRWATTQNVKAAMMESKTVRFMTLTLKHSSNRLDDQIDHLYDSFRRLKRQKSFKEHVKGGIWFFQIKWIDSSQEWHPHLHILWTGRYYPQDVLSEAWRKASSGSWIVDVRQIKDIEKTADYVARYATSPCNLCHIPENLAIIVYDSLFGRRIKGSFGIWKDVELVAKPPDDCGSWRYVGSFWFIMANRRKWALCSQIVESWITDTECPPVWEPPPEPPPDPEPLPEVIERYRQSVLFRL
jgi:hypothetical protein